MSASTLPTSQRRRADIGRPRIAVERDQLMQRSRWVSLKELSEILRTRDDEGDALARLSVQHLGSKSEPNNGHHAPWNVGLHPLDLFTYRAQASLDLVVSEDHG